MERSKDASAPALLVLLLFLVRLSTLLPATLALAVDWKGKDSPDEIVTLPQCEDLTFALRGRHNILRFKKKGRYKECSFDDAVAFLGVQNDGSYIISGDNFRKRRKQYFGCSNLNHCNTINMKVSGLV